MRQWFVTIGVGLGCSASVVFAQANPSSQERALEILKQTKTTTATYVVYTKDYVSIDGKKPFQSWSAEFHSGDLHRVETMKHRLVANCRERTGFFVNLETGELRDGPSVANAACGVNSNNKLVSAEWLGTVSTPFGEADRIQLSDEVHIRAYDVLKRNGALLRATYAAADDDQRIQVWQETLAVTDTLPSLDIFDPESLSESFVPEEYKKLPTAK